MSHKKGFTLIELLVVCSIIAFLASAVFAATSISREKAKIAASKLTLLEISKALELYAFNHGGLYPDSTYTGYHFTPSRYNTSRSAPNGQWIEGISQYYSNLPVTGLEGAFYYQTSYGGTDPYPEAGAYKLVQVMPTSFRPLNVASNDKFYDVRRPTTGLSVCGPMPQCQVQTNWPAGTYYCDPTKVGPITGVNGNGVVYVPSSGQWGSYDTTSSGGCPISASQVIDLTGTLDPLSLQAF